LREQRWGNKVLKAVSATWFSKNPQVLRLAFRGGDPDENHGPNIIIRNPAGTALPVEIIDASIVGTLGVCHTPV
jgi:hypothetical protein